MSGPGAHAALRAALTAAGRRWRNRRLLEGAVLVTAATAAAAAVALAVMDAWRFDGAVVDGARTAVYLLAAVLTVAWLAARVPRAGDARRLARHLESRDPALDALLVTAVEVNEKGGATGLAPRLYRNAAEACADPEGATRADRQGGARAARGLLALLAALALGIALAPPGWRHGALLLLAPWRDAAVGTPYAIEALPGSVTVRENGDLPITGIPSGFAPTELWLVHRNEGAAEWSRLPMERAVEGRHEGLLAAVAAPLEYYLEGDGVRSDTHRVAVQWLPRVERLDHRYHYPGYTGLTVREVRDATDIAAVAGTRVQVRVLPATAPARGELVLDGRIRRPLASARGGALAADVQGDEAARYRIELATAEGDRVAVTPDHAISALPDGAPGVTVARPGGDTRVTPVEEIQVEVRAQDDVSLRQVELVLSVNGAPEEVVLLDGGGAPSVAALHTLHLEERGLAPGDLVALHARASDGVVARTAVTDIQFLEVRPFDRDYSRGRSGGQRGGGGAGGDQDNLAAQQRDLVVALFRLARDGGSLPAAERDERLTLLADAQRRIRERVEAVVRRIQGRSMVRAAPGYRAMLEEMPRAAAAMLRVEALLAVPDPERALPPAREALAHLQRADAAFREVRVAQQQGGGSGGRANNADLARLFELEMDRLRNRYAEVQRSQADPRQQQVDETLKRLEELARRQREEVERALRRAESDQHGGRGAATQQALAQALDELLRRLERLTRERPDAALEATRRALEEAARAMAEAAAGGDANAARDALDRIEQARRALSRDDPAQVAQALDDARRRAESLAERQQSVQRRLERGERGAGRPASGDPRDQAGTAGERPTAETRASADAGTPQADSRQGGSPRAGSPQSGSAQSGSPQGGAAGGQQQAGGARSGGDGGDGGAGGGGLDEQKARMEADAAALREQLDRIAGDTADVSPEVSRRARAAASVMREEDVEGRLSRSREELAAGIHEPRLERAIGHALDRVRERVAEAARAAAARAGEEGAGDRGPPSPEQLRALMRDLSALRDRLGRESGAVGGGAWGRDASRLDGLAGTLDRLRGPVARNPGAAGDLEALIDGIRALAAESGAGTAGGPDRDALLSALSGVERELRRALEGEEPEVRAGRDARAPARYRAQVEEYFRSLGRDIQSR